MPDLPLPDFPTSDPPQPSFNTRCSTCKKTIEPTNFKNCPQCRAQRTRNHKLYMQRKDERARAALLLAKSSKEQQNQSSSPAQPPLKKIKVDPAFVTADIKPPLGSSKKTQPLTSGATLHKAKVNARRSMARSDASRSSPTPTPRVTKSVKGRITHPYYGEDDEYQDVSSAFQALRDTRQALPCETSTSPSSPSYHNKLNFRLTYVVVTDPDLDNNKRIAQVVKSLRDEIGLKFSINSHLVPPGSSPYARPRSICERWRCKCSVTPKSAQPSAPTPQRKQSELGTWLADSGSQGKDADKCGGYVYVSSEYDTSHPSRIRGQRIVVSIVHPRK